MEESKGNNEQVEPSKLNDEGLYPLTDEGFLVPGYRSMGLDPNFISYLDSLPLEALQVELDTLRRTMKNLTTIGQLVQCQLSFASLDGQVSSVSKLA